MSPGNVRAITLNSTVISVHWDGLKDCRDVNGHIVKYRVQYTSESSGVVESKDEAGEWNVTGAETSLTGLTPYTNYTIRVAAVNKKRHVGLYSSPITNQTMEYCEFCCSLNNYWYIPHFFQTLVLWTLYHQSLVC